MAHELYEFENGDYSMAFVGDTPWHGLGQQLDPDAPLEVWAEKAHLNWTIEEGAAAFFDPKDGNVQAIPNRKVLMRGDNRQYLSTVGHNYHVVQPREIIEFFRTLIESSGFRMHTAGSMFNGRRMWALAEIGKSASIMGQDKINGYLLLATACDGTLANTGQFTSIRVVCNNTLEMSISNDRYIKLPHTRKFDSNEMLTELGLGEKAFENFIDNATILAERKISIDEAVEFFINLYRTPEEIAEEERSGIDENIDMDKAIKGHVTKLIKLYNEEDLRSADGTVWGAVNAVTRYYDHERKASSIDHRLNNTWFGDGANMKSKAFHNGLKLAA